MQTINPYLHRSSNVPRLLHSLYLHLHQACPPGRHLLRLVMAVPRVSYLQASIHLSSKAFPQRELRRLRGLDLHLDLDHLLAKVLPPELPLATSNQGLEGLGSREGPELHPSSD